MDRENEREGGRDTHTQIEVEWDEREECIDFSAIQWKDNGTTEPNRMLETPFLFFLSSFFLFFPLSSFDLPFLFSLLFSSVLALWLRERALPALPSGPLCSPLAVQFRKGAPGGRGLGRSWFPARYVGALSQNMA